MDQMEENVQQQVWQRVFAQPEQRRESLRPLILAAQEQASAYRQLVSTLTGAGRELAKALLQETQATILCLSGLEQLSENIPQPPKPAPLSREPARRLLEKSYHRAKRAMTEYTARSLDADFGVVFQHLAQREGLHCVKIAQLLGMTAGEQKGRA